MVVDVGGGTSEVAVISLGGIVVFESVRVGGYDLDEAIIAYVKQRHGITIGQQTAEHDQARDRLGLAAGGRPDGGGEGTRPRLRACRRPSMLTSEEVRRRSRSRCASIIETIKETLERTPPGAGRDIGQRGIMLAGGGSLLRGFDERVRAETKMADPARRLAPDLRRARARGARSRSSR